MTNSTNPPEISVVTLVNSSSTVDQTLRLVEGPARQRGVTIEWQPPTEAVDVEADPMQMRQVLLNLLLNALDAAGETGQVSVEVSRVCNPPEATRPDVGHVVDAYHTIGNEVDRYLLTEALRLTHGNQVEASRVLGISRTTLRAKLESLGLTIEKQVQTNAGQDDQSVAR